MQGSSDCDLDDTLSFTSLESTSTVPVVKESSMRDVTRGQQNPNIYSLVRQQKSASFYFNLFFSFSFSLSIKAGHRL